MKIYVLPIQQEIYYICLNEMGKLYYENIIKGKQSSEDEIVELFCKNITSTDIKTIREEIDLAQEFKQNKESLENYFKSKMPNDLTTLLEMRASLVEEANNSPIGNGKAYSKTISNGKKPPNIVGKEKEAAYVNALLLAFMVEAVGFAMLTLMLLKVID